MFQFLVENNRRVLQMIVNRVVTHEYFLFKYVPTFYMIAILHLPTSLFDLLHKYNNIQSL